MEVKMSKTIRRKKVPASRITGNGWCNRKANDCPVFKNGIYSYICNGDCPYRDDELTISEFHRDTHGNYGWNGSAPKNFRKIINRSKKAKMRQEMRRIMTQGDYEDYTFNPWKKDAGWLYW
jgi:C4-type Zn-finger protein